MILYVKTNCPYCKKVLDFANENNITFSEIKNRDDIGVRDEVIAKGGKSQFPFLIDAEKGVSMYESEDIINYISGSKAVNKSPSAENTGTCKISL